MTQSDLLMLVIKSEPEAITRTLAMMAYNPAIGRVLEKGGVDRFADLVVGRIPGLYGQASRERFDHWHRETCKQIEESFKTSRQELVSYGQAQKPLNVFMKVYIGWAKQPTTELAEAFTPFLHVPLDSLVMKFIAREFPEQYRARIVPLRESLLQWYGDRLEGRWIRRSVINSVIGQEFSLTAINQEIYLAWQVEPFHRGTWYFSSGSTVYPQGGGATLIDLRWPSLVCVAVSTSVTVTHDEWEFARQTWAHLADSTALSFHGDESH